MMKTACSFIICVLFVGFMCVCAYVSIELASTYTNPVVPTVDCPDPGVYYEHGVYYATTTSQSSKDAFPIRSSTDLASWKLVGHIFPDGHRPKWAVTDFWAPEIHFINGHHVAYFAARDTTGVLCVGAAFSATGVLGPYKDIGGPLIRNSSVGNIDPTAFFDETENRWYLIWKEDGNGATPPEPHTPIWAQMLGADGLTVIGERHMLLWNDLPWEGNLVEAPWVVQYGGMYYLFYSANAFYNARYTSR